jgi:putative RecB family exonuclease
MPIYSHSRLSTFEQCSLKFRYSYVDRIKSERRTIEAFMGSRFHEVMEHLYGRLSFEKPDLATLKRLFEEAWERKWSDDIVLIRSDRTADDYRAIGLKAIEDYFRRHEPFDEGQVLGIERNLLTDLDGTGRYKVRCIIDRLMRRQDGRLEIHDYKTSGTLPTQGDVDGDRQLALYEIAVREAWPETGAVDLVWHYVSFDTELRSSRSEGQLAELSERTKALIDEIERTADYPPRESSLCEWCDHIKICPLFAHRFKIEGFGSRDYESDDGQALVNSFASLDAQRHELASRIKGIEAEQERIKGAAVGIAEREGVRRLFGDDHVLNIRDDLKVHYPKKGEIRRQDFETRMRELGIWEDVSDVSWSSLKSLADREGWTSPEKLPDALADLVEVEPTKQVRLARRKDRKDEGED